ncbi:serine hydrolase [Pseudochrobactrum sp. sp1633]|uniref:serine hydrolase n=1 Tax=Pseudochrobactrum sp. sp1633 TaxID=3036706 RepID=UPI0025A659A7|nr:serine hydrolase [Pseudochrobactrum sp. sp1633]MDM8346411.1 serine hydrolase [Pseudochrobactrum sp. sp1633]HWD14248.1 serine hydrolase [Pseudochrobactrum sp.]
MKLAFSTFMAALFMLTPVYGQEVTLPSDADITQILTDRIDRDQAGTGIVVAVVENGKARFTSHGYFGRDDLRPVDEYTLFEAGSITKIFTNLLLAQLVLDGRIDLDAPITNYLPAGTILPDFEGRAITAFDLSTHSSGLSGLPDDLMAAGLKNPYTGYGRQAFLDWLAGVRITRPIGQTFEYSIAGTALLALAITHVDGRSYAQMLQEVILDPLGMQQTSLALTGTVRPDMATGHDLSGAPVSHWDFDVFAPAGALITSASDLTKFMTAASGQMETPLTPAFNLLLERTRSAGDGTKRVGLGPFISKLAKRTIVWHNGKTGGFNSFAGIDRENGNGVIILANRISTSGIEDIGAHLLDKEQQLVQQPKPRMVARIDPALLQNYTGIYQLGLMTFMTVTAEQGQLFIQLTGQQRFAVYPESETKFFVREVDAQISFSVRDGKTTSLTLHQNGRNLAALRVPDPHP